MPLPPLCLHPTAVLCSPHRHARGTDQKMLLVDGGVGSDSAGFYIGSSNMDWLSLSQVKELGCVMHRPYRRIILDPWAFLCKRPRAQTVLGR